MIDLLITNGQILCLDEQNTQYEHGFVAISGNRILSCGSMSQLPGSPAKQILDAAGSLVMPGLINTHCHAPMTLFRGLADDLPLMTWLNEYIFPAEARLVNPEMVYWCAKLAAAEMIFSGTTMVADSYFYETEVARAFVDAGLRAMPAQGIIDFPAPGVPDPEKNIRACDDFLEEWQGKNELITPAVFCHSPYTCSPQTLEKAKELAEKRNTRLFIHIAETREEEALVKTLGKGETITRYLERLEILSERTIGIHAVWLNTSDIEIIKRCGTGISTCPQSNMKLASGTAPISQMLKQKIPTGLGTDGCASNNSLDMFQEMDFCAKQQKVANLDPTAVNAGQILSLATANGAKVLGFGDQLGSLKPGMLADLIIINTDRPHLTPLFNPESALVYSASGNDVSDVIINGKPVMQNRQLIFDLKETISKVNKLIENKKTHN
jgi:5-methylthioadenosine/S-adenosylhomocysteine deaminase